MAFMSLWQEHIQKDVRPAITGNKIHPKRCLACYYMQKNHPKRCKACYYRQKSSPKKISGLLLHAKNQMSGLLLQAKISFHPQFATFIMSAIICRKQTLPHPEVHMLVLPNLFHSGKLFARYKMCAESCAELCKIFVEPLQAKKIFMKISIEIFVIILFFVSLSEFH